MHTSPVFSESSSPSPVSEPLAAVLRAAKKLHRQATGDSLAQSLPVLRRLLARAVLHDSRLTALHAQRSKVQRKHLLRLLALETGFDSWESYKRALVGAAGGPAPLPLDVLTVSAGYPNHWFSSLQEAQAHAAQHGGQAIAVGTQAVVLRALH